MDWTRIVTLYDQKNIKGSVVFYDVEYFLLSDGESVLDKKIVNYSLSLVRSWERELSSFIFALNGLLFFVVGVFVAQYF